MAGRSFFRRRSRMLVPTLFDVPAEAHLASHQLLLRAGKMRRHATGIYDLLPLGLRVMEKVTRVVDEEMLRVDGQKLALPLLNARDLWDRTGRWVGTGPELMRLKDRKGEDYCLAPTHEEVVTALVAAEVTSYRQLPQALYQIGTKFRDEVRPRFGLMRSREFVMKDMYSFHASREEAMAMVDTVQGAYRRVFSRLQLPAVEVDADGGNVGGDMRSTEFQVPCRCVVRVERVGNENHCLPSNCIPTALPRHTPTRPHAKHNHGFPLVQGRMQSILTYGLYLLSSSFLLP